MSENNTSESSETSSATTENKKPQSIQELVAAIDITGVSVHEIITDLIAGIQQLALRGTIALGLLERLATENQPAADETPADEDAPST
jgi:hypothetical protein